MPDASTFARIEGFCPICERETVYEASGPYFRSTLICKTCPSGSVPRERAVALALNETRPHWRTLAVHECSPAPRGISVKLARTCLDYTPTNYFEGEAPGAIVRGHRNENLERQTFADERFDVVVTIDVFEHLFDPAAALREIHRTLRPNGVLISAFPMIPMMSDALRWRAKRNADGSVKHLLEPQYHGNPISDEGSLVTVDYGYAIHEEFARWAPFDVRLTRFADKRAGILGDFTDLVICWKR